jgi:hypothetical protein
MTPTEGLFALASSEMGSKARKNYYGTVVRIMGVAPQMWMVYLSCNHVVTRLVAEKSKIPSTIWCNSCVSRDREILQLRDRLATLEADRLKTYGG